MPRAWKAREFLNGRNRPIIARLEKLMGEAAERLEYEDAAMYRDYIEAAKALSATQRVVIQHSKDIDIVIPARGTEETHMVLFFVRDGKLVGRAFVRDGGVLGRRRRAES